MKRYTKMQIDELAEILKNDGVISVPTDTVYGVCACMNSKKAYENLVVTKNRPESKLFPIMCADLEQIKSVAIVDDIAEKLINAFMPGPITIILKSNPELPKYVNNNGKTIAIRMATSKALEELIKKVGSPIFMTSANISGEPSCQTIEEVEKTTVDDLKLCYEAFYRPNNQFIVISDLDTFIRSVNKKHFVILLSSFHYHNTRSYSRTEKQITRELNNTIDKIIIH